MNPRIALTLAAAVLVAGCEARDDSRLQGYIEGEYVRVAAPVAGQLQQLSVARGAAVEAGAPLFELEQAREQATVSEAGASNAAIRAQAEQASAQWRLAAANLKRLRELRTKGLASQEQVDEAVTEEQRSDARRRELDAQQHSGAARLDQVRWGLTHKSVTAPAAGLVDDTYYRVGEWVPAGAPVVSLLPPQNRIVRFFVPETQLASVKVGQAVQVWRDGVEAPATATISFIASKAEFAPPVIYSQQARAKLVFLVEARPALAEAAALHPGQPVDVSIAP